jgi:hypothetical protein
MVFGAPLHWSKWPKNFCYFQSATEALIGLEDLDELLSGLHPDEINELSIIDPDVRKVLCHVGD